MKDLKILGIGMSKGNKAVKNTDFYSVIDTSDEWITSRTGIKNRYFSIDKNTSDLGYEAAKEAIKNSGIDINEIDLIIVATMTADNFTPSCASLIQAKLGLNDNKITAFDVNAACTGFVYALEIASLMLTDYRCALIIGSEVISKLLNFNDRSSCVLFGDGAGAIILKKENNNKKFVFYNNSIGDEKGKLIARGVNLSKGFNNVKDYGFLSMSGKDVFIFAIKAINEAIDEVLKKANQTIDDIDLIIPHQANIRIIEYVAKKRGLAMDKFYLNIDRFGNTSAASIPIALYDAFQDRKIKDNNKLLLVGFGGGFTYGAAYLEL